MLNRYGITVDLQAEDERYPLLVLTGEFGTAGYTLNKNTGALHPVCICHSYSPSECVCAYDKISLDNIK
jgi:hypothetical protein